jgi:hypothetical protein
MSIFKVVKAKGSDGGALGYEFVEVLAIEPYALTPARTPEDYEKGKEGPHADWAKFGVTVMYVCRTEYGLTKMHSTDLWDGIDYGDYCEDTPEGHKLAKKTRDTYADPPWLKGKGKKS